MSESEKAGPAALSDDAARLAAMGYEPELKRNFSMLSMLGLAFAILNSWTALSASLSLALPSGGATSVIWGLVTAGICNLALAASLAEFLSAYPTAGGQYHWVAVISWPQWMPILSWTTAYINVFGWIALTASGGLLGSQLIVGAIALFDDSYESKAWHEFLIYVGYTLVAFLINAFGTRLLPIITKAAFFWSIAGFAIICITVLSCASPNFQSGSFVFTNFINTTGWPDGVAWLLGLLQGGFGLTAYDAVSHMVEEIPNPTITGPRIMIGCVAIGVFTGVIFLMVLLFVLKDVDTVISSSTGSLLQIYYQATNSKAGSVCLLIFSLVCLIFASTSIMTTSSRMTWAFARDRGLPFSSTFAKVNPTLNLPLNSLIATAVWVIIFGLISLGSSSAFNAIISASVVALGITYAIPPAINCLRGRTQLPESRAFKLPAWLGWTCNLIGIAYTIVTTVLFLFPESLPTTGSNMNYAVVAFGVVLVISVVQWIIDGRHTYKGPRIEVEGLADNEVAVPIGNGQVGIKTLEAERERERNAAHGNGDHVTESAEINMK
ncbi:choline transport protein [Coleophoma crateriformis]|uniref:Choline transport protein n=1 Tax=Coleophoma crateriformis TaxID=565419 RepID=A0A3D8T9V4_9HELO|nr:choline transport protein [Coleophoma crateriformis]